MPPKSNRELLQEFIDAFNRLDIDALVADLDPEAELHEWPEGVGSRSYRGPEGVREALGVWFEAWEWMQVEIDSYNVYRFAEGRVTSIELFTNRDAAVEAFDRPRERTGQER